MLLQSSTLIRSAAAELGPSDFISLLAALFSAGVLVWIADILRPFGWPAFYGFLIPVALEPMFRR